MTSANATNLSAGDILVVTDKSRMVKINPGTGEQTTFWTGNHGVTGGIAIDDRNGTIFVTEWGFAGHVFQLDPHTADGSDLAVGILDAAGVLLHPNGRELRVSCTSVGGLYTVDRQSGSGEKSPRGPPF